MMVYNRFCKLLKHLIKIGDVASGKPKIKGKKECIMARTTLQSRVPNMSVRNAVVYPNSGTVSEPKEVRIEGKLSEAQAYGELTEIETEKFTLMDVEVHKTL